MLRVAIRRAWGAIVLAVFGLLSLPAAAQVMPEGPVLAAADLRGGQDLSGQWNWSIDPYRDGLAGFHGGEAGLSQRRHADTDVASVRRADPLALFEYDMDVAPAAMLPASWLTHSPQMRHYQGLVWYQRRFDAVIDPASRSILRFGAANYSAEVWLNGKRLGRHEGGFTPFAFEVTGMLRAHGNRLVVAVDSQRTSHDVPPPVTDWETYGGITRAVRLINLPGTFVDDAWVKLEADGRISADIRIDGVQKAGLPVRLTIPELGVDQRGATDKDGSLALRFTPRKPIQRWSPDSPKLYRVEISAGEDRWHDIVGFRTLAVQGSQILLNGEPIFLRGISLHEEELGADPTRHITDAAAEALLREARDGLGGNFVRLAHYPHGEPMLRAADRLGMIVWSEIPVYWRIAFDDPAVLEKTRRMLAEMILRDRNRASIALWSVGNETPIGDARNGFMARLALDVRALDPDRLVTAALLTGREMDSGRQVVTISDPLAASVDVLAVNTYFGWYGGDRLDDIGAFVWDLPTDKPFLFSEFGAGAKLGYHAEGPPQKFTEEYQADYYRSTLAMAEGIPTLAGLSPWVLKDFRSPRRQLPGIQDGWNRKGLISETGERKQAFTVLAEWYAKMEDTR
ncbi:MAG: glycoside hydrolase family 2 TIM barrel-domain containing protein [Erythrobacter sp.]|nr:glycoside hydrolase family 2 TIM barrel-domain containing protein [Erythrobacter sp.]